MAGVITYSAVVGDESYTGSYAYTARTEQELVVANGAADTALSLGGVTTGAVLRMESDQTLTINFNSNSGTNITLTASMPMFLAGSSITAIYVSNATGSDANLKWAIFGV